MLNKFIYILVLSSFLTISAKAQELQAKVSVNTSRLPSTVDKKIFNTLQTQLLDFLNNRKWSNDQFNPNEKIDCNFLLNITSVVETNVYQASLIIQSSRPVFNSTYQTVLVNYQDADVTFGYTQYQSMDFSDNRVQGSDAQVANLTAVFAYYSYLILGLDYDSYSMKGGDQFFQKALNIVNNAPDASSIKGWKPFDGLRNRYWLIENLTNTQYAVLHEVIYSYYHSGLDKMYENEKEARVNILKALNQLQSLNQDNPNSMFVQFFLQNKNTELIGVFKKGEIDDRSKALDVLSILDVANSNKYKQELQ